MINDLINGEVADLLPELRPAALPDRARGRQHPTHGEGEGNEVTRVVPPSMPARRREARASREPIASALALRGMTCTGTATKQVDSVSGHLIMPGYRVAVIDVPMH